MPALDRIIAEIERGEVAFPTHADVALRVRLALDDPDLHVAKAAQLIQAEPLLASRVVATANSVLFNRNGVAVADVRSGVARLGLKFVRALATAVVMQQMAGGLRTQAFRKLAAQLWEHTVHVAALSHLLSARFLPRLAETALFAGLVHEVGGFYLISRADEVPELFVDGSLLGAESERRVGEAMLTALAIPGEVADGIRALWRTRSASFPPTELGDLLRLANHLTPIRSPLETQVANVPAVFLDAGAETELAGILEQSGDQLDSLTRALRY